MKSGNSVLYATPELGAKVSDYSDQHSTSLPQRIVDYHTHMSETHEDAQMLSSTFQSKLNVFMARSIGAKRVLEIGVFVGFSALVWSHAVGPDGWVTGLEYEPEFAQAAKDVLAKQGAKNVEIITGDAAESLPKLKPSAPYDLVFMDADKTGYPTYLKQLLEGSKPGSANRLLRPGAVILADNVLRGAQVVDQSLIPKKPRAGLAETLAALKEFNETCKAEPRLEVFMAPLWDGVSMIRLVD